MLCRHRIRRAHRARRGRRHRHRRKTPWGEIAWQLGGEKALAVVAKHDAKGIARPAMPSEQMLPTGPALILMDELVQLHEPGPKVGLGDQFFNFVPESVRRGPARNNMVLCVSIPASELEMNPDDRHDHEAHQKNARPGREGDHDVGRDRDCRDHPPAAVRMGGIARRGPQDGGRICRVVH